MNIGLFTDSYYPEISGLCTSISSLQEELKKRGHRVYIFTTSNPVKTKKYPGVFRLPSMPFIFLKSRRFGLMYSPRAAKCVKRLKLDVIHTQTEFSLGIFGKIMAKQMNIPVVHTYHTLYKDYFHYISKGKFKKLSDNLVKVLSRSYCNGCDAVIAPSLKVYDLLKDYGAQTPIKVIPTGVNLDRFKKENNSESDLLKLKESLGIKKDDPVIVFVGRIAKEKSIDVIMNQIPEVKKQIPNVKFLIVGDGPTIDELKEQAINLGVKKSVIFAGEQHWESIGKFYRLGDVFISSSVTETQGLTIIEAMAADVPVIVKEDRNIETLIQDKVNGMVYKTEKEMVDLIVEILSNKEVANDLAKNAKNTVQEYSVEHFGTSIEALYYKVLERGVKVKRERFRQLKHSKIN